MISLRAFRILLAFACIALGLACAAHADPQLVTCSGAKLLGDGAEVRLEHKIVTSTKSDFSPIVHSFGAGTKVGNVANASVNEASGLAASRKNDGVLWVHNDSGDTARVFAMTPAGTHLGIYNLSGVTAIDCEDMAVGPGPVKGKQYIYLADIGDNNAVRSTIRVYRVEEPTVSSTQQPVTVNLTGVQTLTFVYEDGARDAETLVIDPRNGDLYVVSKRESRSRVYRAAASTLTPGTSITLRYMAQLPWGWATAGDISPQGDEIIIRGYLTASAWARPPNSNLWDAFSGTAYTAPLIAEPQGEAVAYDAKGNGYYTVSEGVNQPINYFARQSAPPAVCFYVEESNRSAGIRVSAPATGFDALVRGKFINLQGNMATTTHDERYVANPVVEPLSDQLLEIKPLGVNQLRSVGGDWGSPPTGQYGASDCYGLNSVGLLGRVWGRVDAAFPLSGYVTASDGSGVEFRIDITGLRESLDLDQFVAVTGIMGIRKSGSAHVCAILPRSDGDISRL